MKLDTSKYKNAKATLEAAKNIFYRVEHAMQDEIAAVLVDGPLNTEELCAITNLSPQEIRELLVARSRHRYNRSFDVLTDSGATITHDHVAVQRKFARILPDGTVDMNQTMTQNVRLNRYMVL